MKIIKMYRRAKINLIQIEYLQLVAVNILTFWLFLSWCTLHVQSHDQSEYRHTRGIPGVLLAEYFRSRNRSSSTPFWFSALSTRTMEAPQREGESLFASCRSSSTGHRWGLWTHISCRWCVSWGSPKVCWEWDWKTDLFLILFSRKGKNFQSDPFSL